jgi:phosphate transport system permease protein
MSPQEVRIKKRPNSEKEGRNSRSSLLSRRRQEQTAGQSLFIITLVPIGLVFIITVVLALRFWPILKEYSLWELVSGTVWKPMQGKFGFWPFIAGTLWVTVVGVGLAVPPCLLTALYLSEYARAATRTLMKPLLDLLAAIPSVVYGVWGVVAIVPFVGNTLAPWCEKHLGFIPLFTSKNPTGYSVLAGGIVLAVMIAPFIIAVTYEVLSTVPQALREASLAVGATRWQTTRAIVLRQTLPGILVGVVLGATRAVGETMAVLMVVGNVPQVPKSIFDAAYPLPALIANNYGEMMSIPLYDAALLGAAFLLLVMILTFNVVSTAVLRRMLTWRPT